MKTLLKHLSCFCLFFIFGTNYAIAQNYQHDFDQVVKKVDDLLWYEKVGDIAHIDKVYLCGPARWKETNPTGMSAGNERSTCTRNRRMRRTGAGHGRFAAHSGARMSASSTPSAVPVTDMRSVASSGATIADR